MLKVAMSQKKAKPKAWKEFKRESNRFAQPVLAIEWGCEWLSYWLSRWALLEVLEYAGKLTIVVALITYLLGGAERKRNAENQRQIAEDQRKARHYQAWQVINSAQGKPGDGGRALALRDLDRSGISLWRVDLSHAVLDNLTLTNNTILAHARLEEAVLGQAVITNANCFGANLAKALLKYSDLNASNFRGSIWRNTTAYKCDFSSCDFGRAQLGNSAFYLCDFTRANLANADLHMAEFAGVNFAEADLRGLTNWQTIRRFEMCNLFGVQNPPEDFIKWAKERGASFTNISKVLKWLPFHVENLFLTNDDLKPVDGW